MKVRHISDAELSLSLKCRNKLIREVRQYVRDFARARGFSDDEIFDIELALNEAIANVIEHAYRGDENGKVDIKVVLDRVKEQLEIKIRDYGRKTDPEKFKSRDLTDLREGGLGLFLMRNLMDEVIYNSSLKDGTEVLLRKKRSRSHTTTEGRDGNEN